METGINAQPRKIACTWAGCDRMIGIDGKGGHMYAHRQREKKEHRMLNALGENMMTTEEAGISRRRSQTWADDHMGIYRKSYKEKWTEDAYGIEADMRREFDQCGTLDDDCGCGCQGDIECHVKWRILGRYMGG